MRTDIRIAAAAALLLCGAMAHAQQDPHSGPAAAPADLSQLTPEQRRDAVEAFTRIVCNCPKENWSRTLLSCPDACAERQKGMVLRRIAEGWTIDRVVAEQTELFGLKAAADPGSSRDGSLWVTLLLGAGVVTAIGVLLSWNRRAARDAADRPPAAASGDETSAIERELREID